MSELERLRAERDFLLDRAAETMNRIRRYDASHTVGISSNAMVVHLLTGCALDERDYPHDPSDLGRCTRTVERLPAHLRARGDELLTLYRQRVAKRYPALPHQGAEGGGSPGVQP